MLGCCRLWRRGGRFGICIRFFTHHFSEEFLDWLQDSLLRLFSWLLLRRLLALRLLLLLLALSRFLTLLRLLTLCRLLALLRLLSLLRRLVDRQIESLRLTLLGRFLLLSLLRHHLRLLRSLMLLHLRIYAFKARL